MSPLFQQVCYHTCEYDVLRRLRQEEHGHRPLQGEGSEEGKSTEYKSAQFLENLSQKLVAINPELSHVVIVYVSSVKRTCIYVRQRRHRETTYHFLVWKCL